MNDEAAFEQQKKRSAIAFLIAVAVMLVLASILVYYLLRFRPV